MSVDDRKNDEVENLPERPVTDASQVKGGAKVPASPTPVPVPYPNVKLGSPRVIIPCV